MRCAVLVASARGTVCGGVLTQEVTAAAPSPSTPGSSLRHLVCLLSLPVGPGPGAVTSTAEHRGTVWIEVLRARGSAPLPFATPLPPGAAQLSE